MRSRNTLNRLGFAATLTLIIGCEKELTITPPEGPLRFLV